jgi:hypothetical protein
MKDRRSVVNKLRFQTTGEEITKSHITPQPEQKKGETGKY